MPSGTTLVSEAANAMLLRHVPDCNVRFTVPTVYSFAAASASTWKDHACTAAEAARDARADGERRECEVAAALAAAIQRLDAAAAALLHERRCRACTRRAAVCLCGLWQPASEPPGCWQVFYIQLPSLAPRLCMPPSAAPAPGRAARGRPRRAPRPRRTRRTRPWRRSCARAQRRLSRRWRRRKGRPRRRARSARSPRAPCGAPAARQEHRVAPPQRHPNQSHDLLSCSRSMPCVPPSLPPRSPPTRGRRRQEARGAAEACERVSAEACAQEAAGAAALAAAEQRALAQQRTLQARAFGREDVVGVRKGPGTVCKEALAGGRRAAPGPCFEARLLAGEARGTALRRWPAVHACSIWPWHARQGASQRRYAARYVAAACAAAGGRGARGRGRGRGRPPADGTRGGQGAGGRAGAVPGRGRALRVGAGVAAVALRQPWRRRGRAVRRRGR